MLLYVTFVMYIVILVFAYLFDIKWLLMIVGLLWLIPIFEINNVFIVLVSSVMILAHFMLGFYEKKDGEFPVIRYTAVS